MKKIKAILIDPFTQKITAMEIEPSLQVYYKLLDCELVEAVHSRSLSRDNFLYVDEEGLFKGDDQKFFELQGWGYLAGKALVLRVNGRGATISTTETVESITRLITF